MSSAVAPDDPATSGGPVPPGAGRPPGKVIVVMPAMNAAATLDQTVANIPRDRVDEVILVDDHSTDETVDIARGLPVHLVWHPHRAGYGPTRRPAISKPCSARVTWS